MLENRKKKISASHSRTDKSQIFRRIKLSLIIHDWCSKCKLAHGFYKEHWIKIRNQKMLVCYLFYIKHRYEIRKVWPFETCFPASTWFYKVHLIKYVLILKSVAKSPREGIKPSRIGLKNRDRKFSFFLPLTLSWRRSLSYRTSPLICCADQWAGFYMILTSVMKELK